jgi:hypothetical protein
MIIRWSWRLGTRVSLRLNCSTLWRSNPHLGRGNCPCMAPLCKICDEAFSPTVFVDEALRFPPRL